MKTTMRAVLGIVTTVLMLGSSAFGEVIDDFSTAMIGGNALGGAAAASFSGDTPNSGSAQAGIGDFGMTRTATSSYTSGPGQVSLRISAGSLGFSQDGMTLGAGVVSYIGNADFNGLGLVVISVESIDLAGANLQLIINGGAFDETQLVNVAGDVIYDISGAGLGNVTDITLNILPTGPDVDIVLSGITATAVPEPASLAVWGFMAAVGGVGYSIRRRKRAQSDSNEVAA